MISQGHLHERIQVPSVHVLGDLRCPKIGGYHQIINLKWIFPYKPCIFGIFGGYHHLRYAFYTLHQDKRDVSSVAKEKAENPDQNPPEMWWDIRPKKGGTYFKQICRTHSGT